MKILHLTLKKKWFELIKSGVKKEEYREIKPYWIVRLFDFIEPMEGYVFQEMFDDLIDPFDNHTGLKDLMDYFKVRFKDFTHVKFKNGYKKDAPSFIINIKNIRIAKGKKELGAEENKYYFVIYLGDEIKI